MNGRYLRIWFVRPGGKTRRARVQVIRDTPGRMTAWVVDRDGQRTDEMVVLTRGDILASQPLALCRHYGTLVAAGDEVH